MIGNRRSTRDWLDALARSDDGGLFDDHGYGPVEPQRRAGEPEHLVCLLVAGCCRAVVSGRSVLLAAGDALWVPPHVAVTLEVVNAPSIAYRLRPRAAGAPETVSPFLRVPNSWALRPLLDAAVRELDAGGELATLCARSLLVATLSRMLAAPTGATGLSDTQTADVVAHARADPAGRPAIGELAAVAGLPQDTFARRFRATFGQSPRSWLVSSRVHAAARRLDTTDESIGAVASYYGYPDVFFFSRQFKAVVGVAPGQWRQRER